MTKEIIKFEHVDAAGGDSIALPDGYDGFHWDGIDAYNSDDDTSGGYKVGTRGHSIGYNRFGYDASFSSDTSFTLKSGYFTAAFYSEHVKFTAFVGATKVGHQVITIDELHQTFVHFNRHFRHIDSVHFTTGNAAATQMVMDNLKVIFDGAIPTSESHHDPIAQHDPFAPHVAHVLDMHAHDLSMHHHADAWMFC